MKAFLKFDFNILTKKILEQKLSELGLKPMILSFGEIEFSENISAEKLQEMTIMLNEYGIEVIENQKSILVQKIKDTITEMVNSEEPLSVKSSVYLTEKLNHSYGYLSNLFSEVTYTSIENFIIIQKIELAKSLIINNQLTLTEIAFKLNYSSVAHLSTQFKNITGITPSAFQRIIAKRRLKSFN
ncbi:MAG TPA: AraC family transcriptional regulator [Flavobacterium sp.]|uniref:helix-turn-helix domain-containing protein n=1 Tax=unclassified Flavobacterium TaxID=196869 RepID=UPI0025C65C0F|nr:MULTISPECIES: AraC family transcriptional regulator [unclassified Flavobacterium]HRE76966.1 AraC family transcriptional regulator [Flavobacterium sp.]